MTVLWQKKNQYNLKMHLHKAHGNNTWEAGKWFNVTRNIIPDVGVFVEETDDIVVVEIPRSYFKIKKKKKIIQKSHEVC